jgi:hypothetical protein
MPKLARQSPLDRTVGRIVARAAADIAHAVRQTIATEVAKRVDRVTLGRARRVILCPVPNCGKPGGGPKWGWFCANHKNLPESEKEKARAATRARPRPAAAAKRSRKKK